MSRAPYRRRERVQRLGERPQLQPAVQLAQPFLVGACRDQILGSHRERHRRVDGRELSRQFERGQLAAQILSDFARDVGRARDQGIQRLVLIEPFGGSLRPDAGDAGDVVRAVADQRKVIDDLFGEHVEFRLHSRTVEARIGHGVDQRYARIHELRHILVAGGDQHVEPGGGTLYRQRADHVIRLDAGDAQQRQAEPRHRLEQGR